MTTTISLKNDIQILVDNHIKWVEDNQNLADIKTIADGVEFAKMASHLQYTKTALKIIGDARLEMTKPLREYVDKANKKIKDNLETPLSNIKSNLEKVCSEWKQEQFRIETLRKKEEMETIRLKEEESRKALEQNGHLTPEVEKHLQQTVKDATDYVNITKNFDAQKRIGTDMGSLIFTSRFVFDEENSSILELCTRLIEKPELARFLSFNVVQINKELKPTKDNPVVEIAGIKFKEVVGSRNST